MPTYAFKCSKCNCEKEEFKMISKRDELVECPECQTKMDRLIGSGSCFNLKGKGFYKPGWN